MVYPTEFEKVCTFNRSQFNILEHDHDIYDVPRDGNCFFHAVCCSPLFMEYNHHSLKEEMFILYHTLSQEEKDTLYEHFFDIDRDERIECDDIYQYMTEYMLKNSFYGGFFDAILIAYLFKVEIQLISLEIYKTSRFVNADVNESNTIYIILSNVSSLQSFHRPDIERDHCWYAPIHNSESSILAQAEVDRRKSTERKTKRKKECDK